MGWGGRKRNGAMEWEQRGSDKHGGESKKKGGRMEKECERRGGEEPGEEAQMGIMNS